MGSETIRVIISRDCGVWTAQCLEYDIFVQADDLDDLRSRFEVALRLESTLHGDDLSQIGPAPQHFQEQWERRSGSYTPHDMTPANQSVRPYEMAMYG